MIDIIDIIVELLFSIVSLILFGYLFFFYYKYKGYSNKHILKKSLLIITSFFVLFFILLNIILIIFNFYISFYIDYVDFTYLIRFLLC